MTRVSKQTTWLTVILVLIFAVLLGFSRRNPVKELSSQPVKIGAILPLSGTDAVLGEALKLGYTLEAEELAKEGKQVIFYIEDSKSDPKIAAAILIKLTKGTRYILRHENPLERSPALLTHNAHTDLELIMSAVEQTGAIDPFQIIRYIKSLGSFKGKYKTVEITSDGNIK
jgi:ABC-type branched-subunit amino acid transport system substrate-binding protein